MKTKFVYLLKNEYSDRYKIGVSTDPLKRLCQLQTGNDDLLRLVTMYRSKYAYRIEKTFHNTHSHLKTSGEWFELPLEKEVDFLYFCQKAEEKFINLKKLDNPFI